jgi:CSLREA domain-containing protein
MIFEYSLLTIERIGIDMKTTPDLIRRTLLASVIAGMFAVPAGAATISVNTTNDTIADDGFCSLREAVIAANTNTTSGVTAGECPVKPCPRWTISTFRLVTTT